MRKARVGRVGAGPRRLVGVAGPGRSTSPALATVGGQPSAGVGPHGVFEPGVSGLAEEGEASPYGARWGLACEQPGGIRQQRGEDAAGQAPEDDAGITGPEASVLEPASVPDRPP